MLRHRAPTPRHVRARAKRALRFGECSRRSLAARHAAAPVRAGNARVAARRAGDSVSGSLCVRETAERRSERVARKALLRGPRRRHLLMSAAQRSRATPRRAIEIARKARSSHAPRSPFTRPTADDPARAGTTTTRPHGRRRRARPPRRRGGSFPTTTAGRTRAAGAGRDRFAAAGVLRDDVLHHRRRLHGEERREAGRGSSTENGAYGVARGVVVSLRGAETAVAGGRAREVARARSLAVDRVSGTATTVTEYSGSQRGPPPPPLTDEEQR